MSETQTLLLDRYSVVHIERASNFSKIFFALDTYQSPPRSCLVKVFEPIIQEYKTARWIETEFNREAKRLKQLSLSNRNLPEIYTYSSECQVYYLVRELIEGEPLNKIVQHKGTFSTQQVRELLLKLLPVVDYLHQAGVIHQNIKPKNIILRNDDHTPMLINFGSVKHIISTYKFYRDKQIFSTNNVYGYAPSELPLGKSVPASDLYSLGLTVLYLLTGKNPIDLSRSDTGNIIVPPSIRNRDSDLAAIITRAINSNISDRYQSATAMLNDLQKQIKFNDSKSQLKNLNLSVPEGVRVDSAKSKTPRNWFKLAVLALATLYILGTGALAFYNWSISRDAKVSSLSKQSESASETSVPTESSQVATTEPLALNSPSEDKIEIPIFATGTTKEEVRNAIGEPSAIQKGYWANSSAWIYKNQANNTINLGYLFDLDTNRLRQTEVALAPSIGIGTIQDILTSLLEGSISPSIEQELGKVYNRQTKKYSFKSGNLEGSIEREADGQIYLGVWEEDFH